MTRERRDDLVVLALAALWLVFAFHDLGSTGVHPDEARYLLPDPAVPFMSNVYVGNVSEWLIRPAAWMFGVGLGALRAPMILLSLAAVLLWTRTVRLLDPAVPVWAPAALALLHSGTLEFSRTGAYAEYSAVTFASALIAWTLARWSARRDARSLAAACAALGFALWTRMNFLWFLPPAAWLLRADLRRRPGPALAAFLAGCAPLLAYNVWSGGATLKLMLLGLLAPSEPGAASNLALIPNLLLRVEHLGSALAGHLGHPWLWAAPVCAAAFWRARRDPAVGFAAALSAFYLLTSTLTVSFRTASHLYPVCLLTLVAAGAGLARLLPRRAALAAALAALIAPQAAGYAAFWKRGQHDVLPYYSNSALAEMAAWLAAQDAPARALDWGIRGPVHVYSGGKVTPSRPDAWGADEPAPRGTLLLVYDPPVPGEPRRGAAARLGTDARRVKRFTRADGEPVYAAWRVN